MCTGLYIIILRKSHFPFLWPPSIWGLSLNLSFKEKREKSFFFWHTRCPICGANGGRGFPKGKRHFGATFFTSLFSIDIPIFRWYQQEKRRSVAQNRENLTRASHFHSWVKRLYRTRQKYGHPHVWFTSLHFTHTHTHIDSQIERGHPRGRWVRRAAYTIYLPLFGVTESVFEPAPRWMKKRACYSSTRVCFWDKRQN